MREPANKRMLTDVSGLRSHRCTIIASTLSPQRGESRGCGASVLDKGHKRIRFVGNWMKCAERLVGGGGTSRPAPARRGETRHASEKRLGWSSVFARHDPISPFGALGPQV